MADFFKDNGKKFLKIHNSASISIEDMFKAFKERIEEESVIELTDIVVEDDIA